MYWKLGGRLSYCCPHPPYPNLSHFLPHSTLSNPTYQNLDLIYDALVPKRLAPFSIAVVLLSFGAKADYLTDFDNLDEATTDLSLDFRARCLPEGHLSLWVAPTSISIRRNADGWRCPKELRSSHYNCAMSEQFRNLHHESFTHQNMSHGARRTLEGQRPPQLKPVHPPFPVWKRYRTALPRDYGAASFTEDVRCHIFLVNVAQKDSHIVLFIKPHILS